MARGLGPPRAGASGKLAAVASLDITPSSIVADVAALLGEALALAPGVTASLTRETMLFGNLPELDSMAVATVLTALEDRFHILIDDDEVSGELFETVGSLADFIAAKTGR
jgi:acyl carrier protein